MESAPPLILARIKMAYRIGLITFNTDLCGSKQPISKLCTIPNIHKEIKYNGFKMKTMLVTKYYDNHIYLIRVKYFHMFGKYYDPCVDYILNPIRLNLPQKSLQPHPYQVQPVNDQLSLSFTLLLLCS